MKQKQFYSHLVDLDGLHKVLDELGLGVDQKEELLVIVHTSIHYVVLDAALSGLSSEDKKLLLSHIKKEDYSGVWNMLKEKTVNIESKIKERVGNLLQELRSDIKNTLSQE